MKICRVVCIMALVLGIAVVGYAAEKRTAQVISFDGKAEVKQVDQTTWVPAAVGTILNEGDTLKTGAGSWALLNVDEGKIGTVEVKASSEMTVAKLVADSQTNSSQTLLDLAMGEVLIKAQKVHGESSKFEVKTPTSIVGVRGTTFNVKVEAVKD